MPKPATIVLYNALSKIPGRDLVEEIFLPIREHSVTLLRKAILCCPALHTVRLAGAGWGVLDTWVLGSSLQTVELDCPVYLESIETLLLQCSRLKTLECPSILWQSDRLGPRHWFEVQRQSLEHIHLDCAYSPSHYEFENIPTVCGTNQQNRPCLEPPLADIQFPRCGFF